MKILLAPEAFPKLRGNVGRGFRGKLLNRSTRVECAGGFQPPSSSGEIEYRYDALGRRVMSHPTRLNTVIARAVDSSKFMNLRNFPMRDNLKLLCDSSE